MVLYFDHESPDGFYRVAPEPVCPAVYIMAYIDDIDDTDDDNMMRQPPYSVARILQLFETQSPQSFTQLERYRIPRFVLRRIFRSVIGYVLRNVNVSQPLPQAPDQLAQTLLGRLMSTRPMFQNLFTYFGVPATVSRSILLNSIVFTLNHLTSQAPGMPGADQAVNRLVRMVQNTTGVFAELARYRVAEAEARSITASIVRHVLASPPTGASGIDQRITQLTDHIIRNTDVYRNLISRAIPVERARAIIRTVVTTALKGA